MVIDYPVLPFADRAAWAAWLEAHHAAEPGVWVRLSKAGAPEGSVSYPDAVEVALCYGWIDGQSRRQDAEYWLQKFTPRGRRSMWSKRNRERVEALIERGEMRPPGLAAVEAARSDGRWDRAYDSAATATVPDDLRAALDAAGIVDRFDALSSQNRYALLFRIQTAVRPETRARRIESLVAMLSRGETIHP